MNCNKCGSQLIPGAARCSVCGDLVNSNVAPTAPILESTSTDALGQVPAFDPAAALPAIQSAAPAMPATIATSAVAEQAVAPAPVAPIDATQSIQLPRLANAEQPLVASPSVAEVPAPTPSAASNMLVEDATEIFEDFPYQVEQAQMQSQIQPVNPAPAAPVAQAAQVAPAAPVQPIEPAVATSIEAPKVDNNQKDKAGSSILNSVLCMGFSVAIVVLLVLIVTDKGTKALPEDNRDKIVTIEDTTTTTTTTTTTAPTTTTTTSSTPQATKPAQTSGDYVTFENFQYYIPSGFSASVSDDMVVYTSSAKKQSLAVYINNYTYAEYDKVFEQAVVEYKKLGMNVTFSGVKEHQGKKFSLISGDMSGVQISYGFAELRPGYTLEFSLYLGLTPEEEYIETLHEIITNTRYISI